MEISARIVTSLAVVGLTAGLMQTSHAEIIYKSVGADGVTAYSAERPTDARSVEEIDVRTLSPEQRRAAALLRSQERAVQSKLNSRLAKRDDAWRALDQEILSAHGALAKAERALQTGREPRAGERLGNRGGGSRLRATYFERIRALELSVQAARTRLTKTYRVRDRLR